MVQCGSDFSQVMEDPDTFVSCAVGNMQTTGEYFGLPVVEFQGSKGFVDYMYSYMQLRFLSGGGRSRARHVP